MKASKKRSRGTPKHAKRAAKDPVIVALEQLNKAQLAHIADLRTLIDTAHDRETELSQMVKLAMEHQFYRPTITGKPGENRVASALPTDSLQDVAVFDEKEDAAQSKQQEDSFNELSALITEQNQQGVTKVEVQ